MIDAFIVPTSTSYLPAFLVLYDSIKQFHPESKIVAWTLGDFKLPVEVDERHIITESASLAKDKAKFFLKGIENHERIVYCGADTLLYSKIDDSILDDFNIVIIPHITRPLPDDGKHSDEIDVQRAGHCNADFAMLKKSDTTKLACGWLDRRLAKYCRIDPAAGLFNEQSWMSLMIHLFDGILAWRNMTLNVAYWNCHLYNLHKEDNQYVTDGGPLVLFHFSGFTTENPSHMSVHQDRYVAKGDILELYEDYGQRLEKQTLLLHRDMLGLPNSKPRPRLR